MSKGEVAELLEPLIQQAEREDKLLHCSYQDLTFTPAELRARNAEGRFLWGPVNWTLWSVATYLAGYDTALASAKRERDAAYAKVGRKTP